MLFENTIEGTNTIETALPGDIRDALDARIDQPFRLCDAHAAQIVFERKRSITLKQSREIKTTNVECRGEHVQSDLILIVFIDIGDDFLHDLKRTAAIGVGRMLFLRHVAQKQFRNDGKIVSGKLERPFRHIRYFPGHHLKTVTYLLEDRKWHADSFGHFLVQKRDRKERALKLFIYEGRGKDREQRGEIGANGMCVMNLIAATNCDTIFLQ